LFYSGLRIADLGLGPDLVTVQKQVFYPQSTISNPEFVLIHYPQCQIQNGANPQFTANFRNIFLDFVFLIVEFKLRTNSAFGCMAK
jgi:hypothetical protein